MICINYDHYEVYDQEGYIEGTKLFFIKKGGLDSLIKKQKIGIIPGQLGQRNDQETFSG